MDINNPVKMTTYKKPQKDIIKKLLTVMTMVFILFVVPATVNVALTSQDARNKAQVISDNAATDVKVVDSNPISTLSNDNVFWKIYPFVVGIVILIWGGLIIIYIGSKFGKRI